MIEKSNIGNLLDNNGLLTKEGGELTKSAQLGNLIPNADVLRRIRQEFPSIIEKLERSLPSLVLMKQLGGEWDISPKLLESLDLIRSAQARFGGKSASAAVNAWLIQPNLVGMKQYSNAAKILAVTLTTNKSRDISYRFAQMANDARSAQSRQGGGLLGGAAPTRGAQDSFIDSFLHPIAVIDNAPIGRFSPSTNIRHSAIEYADKNGGTFQAALNKVQEDIASGNGDPAVLNNIKRELLQVAGQKHEVLTPDLGMYNGIPDGETLWSRALTPDGERRGSVSFEGDSRTVVRFFQSADFSTAPHEMYHIFRREMADTALHGSEQEKADWKAICDFVGAEEGSVWTREQEEKFALAGERYLAEGQAPSAELAGPFARLKQWFLDLYRKISDVGVEISPAMRNVFDRMISSDLPRNEMADWLRAGLPPESRRDLMRAMEKALSDFDRGEAVDVGQVLRESRALAEGHDLIVRDPLAGDKNDIIARLEPKDMEDILVHHGPIIWNDKELRFEVQGRRLQRATGSRGGYGLAKIIFLHGEKREENINPRGGKRTDTPPVSREDVVHLPKYIREWTSTEIGTTRVWEIPKENGYYLKIVTGKGADGPNSRLVTMFYNDTVENVSKKKNSSLDPSSQKVTVEEDTSQAIKTFVPDSQARVYNSTISQDSPPVNPQTTSLTSSLESSIDEQIARAQLEARADIPQSDFEQRAAQAKREARLSFETERELEYPQAPPLVENAAEVAQNYQERMRDVLQTMNGGKPLDRMDPTNRADLDAETALHEEIAEGIERARQAGLLTEEQQRELILNREQTEKAKQFDEMGQTAVECVWNAAEHI